MLKTHLKASPYRPKIALTVWFASGFTPKGHFWQVAAQFEQQLFNRLIIHIRGGVDYSLPAPGAHAPARGKALLAAPSLLLHHVILHYRQ